MAWYKIFASADQAKNRIGDKKIQLVKIRGRRIFITRLNDSFYAADNECPHQGAYLNEGEISDRYEVVCPWHGYRFSLKSGNEISQKCRPLQIFDIRIDNEGFFVNADV